MTTDCCGLNFHETDSSNGKKKSCWEEATSVGKKTLTQKVSRNGPVFANEFHTVVLPQAAPNVSVQVQVKRSQLAPQMARHVVQVVAVEEEFLPPRRPEVGETCTPRRSSQTSVSICLHRASCFAVI